MESREPPAARLERKKAEAAFISHSVEMNDPIAEFDLGRRIMFSTMMSVTLEAEKVSVKVSVWVGLAEIVQCTIGLAVRTQRRVKHTA
ncbi:hypothetical protein FHX15_004968 [Rhizobium sp. BK650]|nr:hypothetical protein [Rhizobium sp. BK650]